MLLLTHLEKEDYKTTTVLVKFKHPPMTPPTQKEIPITKSMPLQPMIQMMVTQTKKNLMMSIMLSELMEPKLKEKLTRTTNSQLMEKKVKVLIKELAQESFHPPEFPSVLPLKP